jgi:hypothetical protein
MSTKGSSSDCIRTLIYAFQKATQAIDFSGAIINGYCATEAIANDEICA